MLRIRFVKMESWRWVKEGKPSREERRDGMCVERGVSG